MKNMIEKPDEETQIIRRFETGDKEGLSTSLDFVLSLWMIDNQNINEIKEVQNESGRSIDTGIYRAAA